MENKVVCIRNYREYTYSDHFLIKYYFAPLEDFLDSFMDRASKIMDKKTILFFFLIIPTTVLILLQMGILILSYFLIRNFAFKELIEFKVGDSFVIDKIKPNDKYVRLSNGKNYFLFRLNLLSKSLEDYTNPYFFRYFIDEKGLRKKKINKLNRKFFKW